MLPPIIDPSKINLDDLDIKPGGFITNTKTTIEQTEPKPPIDYFAINKEFASR